MIYAFLILQSGSIQLLISINYCRSITLAYNFNLPYTYPNGFKGNDLLVYLDNKFDFLHNYDAWVDRMINLGYMNDFEYLEDFLSWCFTSYLACQQTGQIPKTSDFPFIKSGALATKTRVTYV